MTKNANPISELLTAAQSGDVTAQYELATRYREGDGVEVDLEQAFHWFHASAKQKHKEALRELGTMFRFGQGTQRNLVAAAEFHLIAAKGGDVMAMGNLSEYLKELQAIALSGDPTASRCLSEIYNLGLGVEKSMPLTWTWIKCAKERCKLSDDADEAASIEGAYDFYKTYLSTDDRKEGERVLQRLIAPARVWGPDKPLVKQKPRSGVTTVSASESRGNSTVTPGEGSVVIPTEGLGGKPWTQGHLLERQDRPEEALPLFEKAVKVTLDDPRAWYDLGDTLLALGRYKDARECLEKAISLGEKGWLARYDLGLTLYHLGEFEHAIELFREVIGPDAEMKRASANPLLNAATNLALCYGQMGRWREAISTLRPALSGVANTLFNIGRFYLCDEKYSEARRFLVMAAELEPGSEDILHGAGTAFMKLGEWKMAHTYLSRATRAQPPCAHAWYDLGVTCTKQHAAGIKKTARRCFKHALSIDPQHALAHYDLARLDALSGNRDRAFRHLIRAIDLGLEVTNRVLREPDMKSLRRDVRWKDISRRLRRREKANAPACRGRCYAEKGNAIMARMEEVFARVDDTFARISRNENGRMVPERFDPATGEFVLDWTYLTKLTSPEHAGVDSYWRLTREEFDAEVSKLKG